MLWADSREQNPTILSSADNVRLLRVADTDFSYDLEIHLPDGKIVKAERKRFGDFVASWVAGKLDRQVSYVDILFVEFEPEDVEATLTRYAGDPKDTVGRAMKHLARMTMGLPPFARLHVIPTLGPDGTIAAARYIESGRATRAIPETSGKV